MSSHSTFTSQDTFQSDFPLAFMLFSLVCVCVFMFTQELKYNCENNCVVVIVTNELLSVWVANVDFFIFLYCYFFAVGFIAAYIFVWRPQPI